MCRPFFCDYAWLIPPPAATVMLQQALALFAYPLQGTILAAIIVLFLLGRLGLAAGLLGIFLLLCVLSALVQFSFVVFRASAMGRRKVTVLGPHEFSPLSNPAPWYAVVLALLIGAAYHLAETWAGAAGSAGVAIVVLLLGPAAMTLLVLNDKLLDALNPLHIARMIVAMGAPYALMPAALLLIAGAGTWVAQSDAPWWLRDLALGYLTFLALHALGRIVYAQRERLGLATFNEDTLKIRHDEAAARQRRNATLDLVFQEARTDTPRALALLQNFFSTEQDTLAAREWVFEHARDWPNPGVALTLAQQLIDRHLAAGNAHAALSVLDWGLQTNPAFRPAGASATLAAAQAARYNNRPRLVTAVLSDFGRRFPADARRGQAALTCARTALETTNQIPLAATALAELDTMEGLRDDPRVAALRAMLELR